MPPIPFLEGIQFSNQLGWYAFASIIALAIIYLMRPKPIERDIPSLMFIMKDKGFSKNMAFFRRFFSNLLFLIQMLALILLATAMTSPYTTLTGDQAIDYTVLVIDTSASMQATGRFSQVVNEARPLLRGKISIILAQNVPLVALEEGTYEEATRTLAAITPKDTTSNIGDSMILAGEMLKEKNGKVIILSDFISTEGPDPIVAERIITSKGASVEFRKIQTKTSNAGIIAMTPGKLTTKVIIKNYDDKEKIITLDVVGEKQNNQIKKNVLAKSLETYEFNTPEGLSELKIEEKDDLDVDNHAYLAAQGIKKIRVLLVSNQEKSNLRTALQSSKDIELSFAEPPVIPELNYDIIIMNSVSPSLVLPDFYRDVLKKVQNGTSLIITSQDSIGTIDQSIMPVTIGPANNNSKISTRITNQFTTDIDFGTTFKYYNATPKEPATVIAETDKSPIIVSKDIGAGKIIYYGILDDFSDFKTTVSYPIFWTKMINFLTKTEDLRDYNFPTGKLYASPDGKKYMDKAGFYTVGNRKISASLLSEKESDISKDTKLVFEEEKKLALKKGIEKKDVKFETYLIIGALVIVFLELLYIKWRGDL